MAQIEPAILATTEEQYRELVEKINSIDELSGGTVHIDFADGEYVDNKTLDLDSIEMYPLNLDKEAHLMVKDPLEYIAKLAQLGFKRVIFHLGVEQESEVIEHIHTNQMEVGLALSPESEVKDIKPYMKSIEVVLVMSIHPGYQGQEFLPESLSRIRETASLRQENGLDFLIGVDGGVSSENVKSIFEAGADYVVMGSHLTQGDLNVNLESIWEALQ